MTPLRGATGAGPAAGAVTGAGPARAASAAVVSREVTAPQILDVTPAGPHELTVTWQASPTDSSVRVVCISSLCDFAEICEQHPQLVRDKVHTVAIQGGLEPDPSRASGWKADGSVNNLFDLDAAERARELRALAGALASLGE